MSNDPYFEREQVKYENPVASREYLLTLMREANQALSFLDICHLANATSEVQQVGIQRRLRAMEREGQLQFNRQKKYELLAAEAILTGRVIGHRDGFGFVSFSTDEPDWYLSQGQMQQLGTS